MGWLALGSWAVLLQTLGRLWTTKKKDKEQLQKLQALRERLQEQEQRRAA